MDFPETVRDSAALGGPLAGIRILAVEQVVALPHATQLLARLGADVVKVENPDTGDSARQTSPSLTDSDGRKVGAAYLRNNLGKRSITLNLKTDEGRELFASLAENFDVVADNLRPGTMTRLGLGHEALRERFPRLVYLSISGFGSDPASPYYSWPAYAPTVEAMSALAEAKREPGQPPLIGHSGALGDISTALFGCIGLLAALRQRDRTGLGQHVDVAMFDAMVAMADAVPFMWSMTAGRTKGSRGPTSVSAVFAASDGYFVLFTREPQFATLARLLGHEEWIADPQFSEPGAWRDRADSHLRPAVEKWARNKTKLEACRELCRQGLSAGPCNGSADLATDAHVLSHHMLVEVARPDSARPLLVVGNPIKLSAAPEDRAAGTWPLLGEHTRAILSKELHLSAAELEGLEERGVIAPAAAPGDLDRE